MSTVATGSRVARLPEDKRRIRAALLACMSSPAKEPFLSAQAAL